MFGTTITRRSTRLCGLALLVMLVTGPALAEPPGPPNSEGLIGVSAEQLIDLAQHLQGLVIIDSRLPDDVKRGRIEGAVSLPNNEMTAEKLQLLVKRDQPVLFYCNGKHCPRSHEASLQAVGWGWKQVYWFSGGIEEWTAKSYPLVVATD